jgi:hypothetical protein
MERLLEESAGDDWRLFRARLVAQECAEKDTHKQHNKPIGEYESGYEFRIRFDSIRRMTRRCSICTKPIQISRSGRRNHQDHWETCLVPPFRLHSRNNSFIHLDRTSASNTMLVFDSMGTNRRLSNTCVWLRQCCMPRVTIVDVGNIRR